MFESIYLSRYVFELVFGLIAAVSALAVEVDLAVFDFADFGSFID